MRLYIIIVIVMCISVSVAKKSKKSKKTITTTVITGKSDNYRELLIGCGQDMSKKLAVHHRNYWINVTTLDINPEHEPDIVWDLNNMPLPFDNDTFDEIHAYEVLEHVGKQGDYQSFFSQFSDIYRMLKPFGVLAATCPSISSPWAWGDPSHTRVFQKENFVFLDQTEYVRQIGVTPMSDFRYIYQADFNRLFVEDNGDSINFILEAIKPSRFVAPVIYLFMYKIVYLLILLLLLH